MQLIPCRDIARYPRYIFETPFFAIPHVDRALINPFQMPGLVDHVLAIAANRSGTIANEGSVMLSDGKDLANTSRTLIHEWVRLSSDEQHYESGSAIHRYGALKKTAQKYLEADDHWALKGQSWHWVPATPDLIFERR